MIYSNHTKRIGAAITHHFHKHRKRITNHIIRHHKKYIWGLGAASGIATFKMIVLIFGIGFGLNPQNTYGQIELNNTPAIQHTLENVSSQTKIINSNNE